MKAKLHWKGVNYRILVYRTKLDGYQVVLCSVQTFQNLRANRREILSRVKLIGKGKTRAEAKGIKAAQLVIFRLNPETLGEYAQEQNLRWMNPNQWTNNDAA